MELNIFQVDAFSCVTFSGNPAAVCPLDTWLPDALMQKIAAENNLSETAFYVEDNGRFKLRWFTPEVEVDLCGHATLATAWIIFTEFQFPDDVVMFDTRSGELSVRRVGNELVMDFPINEPEPCATPAFLLNALGLSEATVMAARDFIVILDDEDEVMKLVPDFAALAASNRRGIAVTAPGKKHDFVSRWFGPNVGVNEDPVTGSAHVALAPYWAARLGKHRLTARQGGKRQGELICEVVGARVLLQGAATTYLRGKLRVLEE